MGDCDPLCSEWLSRSGSHKHVTVNTTFRYYYILGIIYIILIGIVGIDAPNVPNITPDVPESGEYHS